MRNRYLFALIIILILLSTVSTYGGVAPWRLFINSSSCNEVSFSWTGGGAGTVTIRIVDITTEPDIQLAEMNFSNPDPDGASYTFSPPLADGTMFNVIADLEDSPGLPTPDWNDAITVVVSCPDGTDSGSSSSEDEPYRELCDDGRANLNLCEPIAIYPIETDDGTGITIWDTRRTGTEGQLVYLAAEELANLPEGNCTLRISEDSFVTVISFNSNIVIIAGPDDENKTFIFYFEEFPGRPLIDTLFGHVELGLPACFD